MPKHKFFTVCYGIILILIIIWLLTTVQFVFKPLVIAFETLIFPFLLAGVLFYLFRPLIDFLSNYRIPRGLAILILYLVLMGIVTALSFMVGPILQNQVNRLIANAPQMADALLEQWNYFQENRTSFPDYVNDLIETATQRAQEFIATIGSNLANIVGAVTTFIVTLVVVPFILFYMLKDGSKAPEQLFNLLPEKKTKEAKTILGDMNKALSTYVQGQIIVSLCVGIMVYIGYLIIGLDYSLVLALVAMFTNVIPFVGPFIGTFPAVIVGLIESPWMMLQVIIVVLIAQQIESTLISPQVMGRVLEVHPLTIILLLLVAGSLGGLIGLILAVPIYAVVKVVVKHTYRLFRLRGTF